ncbi:MAG: sulfotransferase [Pseudomonadota bacterium]|nr:sulfotransferase [Pseudomonadota bacterium]
MQNRVAHSPILVLGMHRSGTSCLAGSLQEAGLFLGDVNTQARFNARGNRESRSIMDLHDQILADNGGSWDAPPVSATWSDAHRARRDDLIDTFPEEVTWGFKDPRCLLAMDGWLEVLPDLRAIGTFRHPMAVAASLTSRNGFSTEKGLMIWLAYNRALLTVCEEREIGIVSFDWPPDRYLSRLEALAASVGLQPPAGGFQFFTSALRKNAAPPETELPAEVQTVYAQLKDRAG